MAHNHHCTLVMDQVFLQPFDRWKVKVVGRFIHHEQVGLHQDHLCQQHTHSPSSTEFLVRTGKIRLLESKSMQYVLGLVFYVVAIQHIHLMQQIGKPDQFFLILRLFQFYGKLVNFLLNFHDPFKSAHGHLKDAFLRIKTEQVLV